MKIQLYKIEKAYKSILLESTDFNNIVEEFLKHSRFYYNKVGMSYPDLGITIIKKGEIRHKGLQMFCGQSFKDLNSDEKVKEYLLDWYEKNK